MKKIDVVAAQYVQRFGYEVATEVIHDPVQTALVQFLQLPGETSYMEFVAPDGAESKLAAAARKGLGLNHFCYTAGPLEGELERLRESGMWIVSAPVAAVAFGGRRICWLSDGGPALTELVERRDDRDACFPGILVV